MSPFSSSGVSWSMKASTASPAGGRGVGQQGETSGAEASGEGSAFERDNWDFCGEEGGREPNTNLRFLAISEPLSMLGQIDNRSQSRDVQASQLRLLSKTIPFCQAVVVFRLYALSRPATLYRTSCHDDTGIRHRMTRTFLSVSRTQPSCTAQCTTQRSVDGSAIRDITKRLSSHPRL